MTIRRALFDIETLGSRREHVVVCSLACVLFSFEEYRPYSSLVQSGFYVKFSIEDQIKKWGRTTEAETLAWWKQQSPEARDQAIKPSANDVSMVDGLEALAKYLKDSEYNFKRSYVWSRGPAFDFPKIESMYDMANIPTPYNGWKQRDVRTYIDILTGVDNGKYEGKRPLNGFLAHNALHDACRDAFHMQEIFQEASGDEIPF